MKNLGPTSRCENMACLKYVPTEDLVEHRGDLLCPACLPKGKRKSLWYALAVEPGTERKVRRHLLHHARKEGVSPKFLKKAIVSTTREQRVREGRRVTHNVKALPGYVLLQCDYGPEVQTAINAVRSRGAWGLLPLVQRPVRVDPYTKKGRVRPFTDRELEKMEPWTPTALETKEAIIVMLREAERRKASKGQDKEELAAGDEVVIEAGLFEGLVGKVLSLKGAGVGRKASVEVWSFGRPTKVELPAWQVKST